MATKKKSTPSYQAGGAPGSYNSGGGTSPTPGSTKKPTTAASTAKDEANFEIILSHGSTPSDVAYYQRHGQNPPTLESTTTLASLVNGLPLKSKGEIAALQDKLVAAHLLDGGYSRGIADNATLAAYRELLDRAYFSSQTPDEALSDAARATYVKSGGAGGGARGPVYSYQPPDPQAVRDAVKATVSPLLGRSLDDAETNAIASAFEASLASADRSAFNVSVTGGTAAPKPDLQAYATQQVKQMHPDEVATYSKFGLANDAMKILGIGGSVGG